MNVMEFGAVVLFTGAVAIVAMVIFRLTVPPKDGPVGTDIEGGVVHVEQVEGRTCYVTHDVWGTPTGLWCDPGCGEAP